MDDVTAYVAELRKAADLHANFGFAFDYRKAADTIESLHGLTTMQEAMLASFMEVSPSTKTT